MRIGLSQKKSLFIKNTAILTATSLVLRGAGMFLKIYTSAKLGAQGVGLYQLIMSVYTLGAGFACSGISAAVTRLTSEQLETGTPYGVRLVVRKCMTFSMAAGLLSAVLIASLAKPIGNGWLSDPRTVSGVRLLALILPVIAASSCMRGYFTARRRVAVNSCGQMAEQTVRVILTVILLGRMGGMGVEYGCIAVILADLAAETVCTVIVTAAYFADRRKLSGACPPSGRKAHAIGKAVWNIAAPITVSHYLTSLLRTVESVLVPDCLTRYESSRVRALELFGMVKGMALPLILFPASVLMVFSTLLVPEISRSKAAGRTGRTAVTISRTLRVTFLLSIPVSGIFILFPEAIGNAVYNEPQLGRIIGALAPFTPLMYAESVAVGILHGTGEQRATLLYGLLDSVLRIALSALLIPRTGLCGFLLVMAISNILTPVLNLHRLSKACGIRFDVLHWVIEPVLCMAVSAAAIKLLGNVSALTALPEVMQLILGAGAATAIYGVLMLTIFGKKLIER